MTFSHIVIGGRPLRPQGFRISLPDVTAYLRVENGAGIEKNPNVES